jgi:ABC-type oligopeptide transport system substrate-binding subunit
MVNERENLFRDKQIASARLDDATLQTAVENKLKIMSYFTAGTMSLLLNTAKGRVTAEPAIRRALQSSLDKHTLVNNVVAIPGNHVAQSIFPAWMKTVKNGFDDDNPLAQDQFNLAVARGYMEEARVVYGDNRIPALTLLTLASPGTLKIAEYMQGLFKRELGLDIKIDSQTMKQWLIKAYEGDFDMTVIGYGSGVNDPVGPGALYTTSSESNLSNFYNPEYDALHEKFKTSSDPDFRYRTLKQMQILLEEHVPVVPLYDIAAVYVQDPRLKRVVRGRLGLSPSYIHARLR